MAEIPDLPDSSSHPFHFHALQNPPQQATMNRLDQLYTPLKQMPDGTYVRFLQSAYQNCDKGQEYGSDANNMFKHNHSGLPFYPFTTFEEFELGSALDCLNVSLSDLDTLLSTTFVSEIGSLCASAID